MENIILASSEAALNKTGVVEAAKERLQTHGWVLLRGFTVDLPTFSCFLKEFCTQLTFDPAREFADNFSQKVNAGKEAVGLHIENGNTPFPPELVAFYSATSAKKGSQTIVCDGAELFKNMPVNMQQQWNQTVTVSRNLPSKLWRKYVVDQHPTVNQLEDVSEKHLADFIAVNKHQRGTINNDDSLDYALDIQPCLANISVNKENELAFANAILGPSFNYEKPQYTYANGQPVCEQLIEKTARFAEKFVHEISWQDGDVVLINNKRVLHGRREIFGELVNRELYIGMGS